LANLAVGIQGFQIFGRGYSYWQTTTDNWGFTVAPWCVIGMFVFVTLLYSNPFQLARIGPDILQGRATKLREKPEIESVRERAWISFLDSL
jgi:hypothetical protein